MNRLAALFLVCLGLAACAPPSSSAARTGIRFLAEGASDGFARAIEPYEFSFPRDHGPHPEFRTEWWYFTGNLQGDEDRHFGFEVTFFRIALEAEPALRSSAWASNQIWMAHFALTDTARRRFASAERLSRESLGLAGASHEPFRVWVEDWRVAEQDDGSFRLRAAMPEGRIDLTLAALKAPVPQGADGLDAKGPEPGNASYYYSIPRLAVSGTVAAGADAVEQVEGLAWMDREWGTSALSPGIAGWDWFALQLGDGSDLMFYRLRGVDGSTSRFSGGTLVAADGERRVLGPDDVGLKPRDWWVSPTSRARYPVAWTLTLGALRLDVRPVLPDQEIDLSVRYWEGAVRVTGQGPAGAVQGFGYLELAGY